MLSAICCFVTGLLKADSLAVPTFAHSIATKSFARIASPCSGVRESGGYVLIADSQRNRRRCHSVETDLVNMTMVWRTP
jgi:hypothetical protein